MEDVKHCNQTLIDMNEQYWKDVEAFAKVTQLASNNMQLCMCFGCILNYTHGREVSMHPSKIPWWLEILITWFNVMAKDIQNVP
jgi:hypothetical protein